ncbi:MAG: glutaredoxin family protein [Burkholderiales bacterium]
MPELTLLSRGYCHLCEEMRDALAPLAERFHATVVEIDVDAFPELEATYGDRVPMLLLGTPAEGVELCRYRLDAKAVTDALARAPGFG